MNIPRPEGPKTNLLFFTTAWLAASLLAGQSLGWMGGWTALLIVILHLCLCQARTAEIKTLLMVAILGSAWESLMVNQGWIHYLGSTHPSVLPGWLMSAWLAFAMTLNHGLAALKAHLLRAGLIGATCAPLAWYGALELGALEMADPLETLLIISISWLCLLPAFLKIANHYLPLEPSPKGR